LETNTFFFIFVSAVEDFKLWRKGIFIHSGLTGDKINKGCCQIFLTDSLTKIIVP